MKNVLKLSILIVLLFAGSIVNAQKFGHTDMQKIITQLPETEVAKKDLEKEAKKIENHLLGMQTEYQKLGETYMQNDKLNPKSPEKWDGATKADKLAEIQGLEVRIQKYQQTAQKTLADKQNKIYQPIYDKVKKAIKDVAVEGKFTYIFDISTLLYYDEKQSVDVSDKVKAKLSKK